MIQLNISDKDELIQRYLVALSLIAKEDDDLSIEILDEYIIELLEDGRYEIEKLNSKKRTLN